MSTRRAPNGEPLLMKALQRGPEWLAKLFLEKGADVNARNKDHRTPLMVAARGHNPHLVKTLVEIGADTDARDDDRKTALTIAKENGQTEIAAFLRSRGARE
ncbi:MAG: ankyrin repeat domain-containing protein [Thermodesulfobacteriota bacterium]